MTKGVISTCDNFLYGFKGAPAARQPAAGAGDKEKIKDGTGQGPEPSDETDEGITAESHGWKAAPNGRHGVCVLPGPRVSGHVLPGQPGSSHRFAGHSVTPGTVRLRARLGARRFPSPDRLRTRQPRRAVITPASVRKMVPATTTPATSPATRAGCPRGTHQERESTRSRRAPGR